LQKASADRGHKAKMQEDSLDHQTKQKIMDQLHQMQTAQPSTPEPTEGE
jgi:hypothetical protein